jgi:hypothetical protein
MNKSAVLFIAYDSVIEDFIFNHSGKADIVYRRPLYSTAAFTDPPKAKATPKEEQIPFPPSVFKNASKAYAKLTATQKTVLGEFTDDKMNLYTSQLRDVLVPKGFSKDMINNSTRVLRDNGFIVSIARGNFRRVK